MPYSNNKRHLLKGILFSVQGPTFFTESLCHRRLIFNWIMCSNILSATVSKKHFHFQQSYRMFNKILMYYSNCIALLTLFKKDWNPCQQPTTYKSRFQKSILISLKSSSNEDSHLVSVLLRTSFCSTQWNNTWPAKNEEVW